uniref:Kynurenine 3-monooxygenase n=1 Tax=Candidatus Kentrum sp. FW TaxID=2126338 RepID=A0A450RZ77_9GAMM|nr:MAG: kynurenine 3-monooxygenase [Candidatus Kentron sp. FW]
MNDNNDNRICIIGAGLTGTLLSLYLAKRGYRVDVYEKRPDMRRTDIRGGRTIVMVISHRGFSALAGIGLEDRVRSCTVPNHSRMVHLPDGSTERQTYGRNGQTINTVERKELNCLLMDEAERTGKVSISFLHQLEGIDMDTGRIEVRNVETGERYSKHYRYVFGADGAFSDVRNAMVEVKAITGELRSVGYGYRELVIPAGHDGDWILDHRHLHTWPRGSCFLVALPRSDRTFGCNLFLPSEGRLSMATIQTEDSVHRLFTDLFRDIKDSMPSLTRDFFTNPSSEIFRVSASPWNYRDRTLLLGDAAHAIAPFFGMGMNVCFEDCAVFDKLLDKHAGSIGKAMEEFGAIRKADTNAIAELSDRNFQDLGNPDPKYTLKWQLSRDIQSIYPERWIPLYVMIAFSSLPLAEVFRRGEVQRGILDKIVTNEDEASLADRRQLERILPKYLALEPELSRN